MHPIIVCQCHLLTRNSAILRFEPYGGSLGTQIKSQLSSELIIFFFRGGKKNLRLLFLLLFFSFVSLMYRLILDRFVIFRWRVWQLE